MKLQVLAALLLALVVSAVLARPAPTGAAGTLQLIAAVGGQPDDITVDTRGRLVWGDLARGTLQRLDGRNVVTIARGLSVPEGLIAQRNGTFIVAEQGYDRIDLLGSRRAVHVVYALRPVAGQEGVDGIGLDPRNGTLLVPDSPNGRILRMTMSGRNVRVIASGLGRPVDAAADTRGDVLAPDEHLGTLVVVTPGGHVSYQGSLATPDDVSMDRGGRVWITTLGDGGLWVIDRGASAPRRVLVGLANPQGLTLDRCGDPIVVEQNTARIVRLLLTSASRRCAF